MFVQRRIENTSSESTALTLQDVKNALEEVKTLLRERNHEPVLPAIQSQVNELTEQVRSQEFRLAEITSEAGATANAEMVQHAATASSNVLQEPTTRQNPRLHRMSCRNQQLGKIQRMKQARLRQLSARRNG
ncbi:hypothetical protein MTO96_036746 [Rhipicephalus appendiculatus]